MATRFPFLLITGPSAAGKSTCISRLTRSPRFRLSVSYTTRPPRATETDGVNYHFVSRERFAELLAQGAFLEHAQFGGEFYGTPGRIERAHKQVAADGKSDTSGPRHMPGNGTKCGIADTTVISDSGHSVLSNTESGIINGLGHSITDTTGNNIPNITEPGILNDIKPDLISDTAISDPVIIYDVEADGYEFFLRNHPDGYFCLLTAPEKELRRRLVERATRGGQSEIERRMGRGVLGRYEELRERGRFNRVIVNDGTKEDFERAVDEMADEILR